MKLLSFATEGKERLGALAPDGGIVDLSRRSADPACQSMQLLIALGAGALERVRQLAQGAVETIDPATVQWLAPLPQPMQLRDFVAFEEHMRNAGRQVAKLRRGSPVSGTAPESAPVPSIWYDQPLYYKGNRFAVTGPDQTVHWPTDSVLIDYELELACVIGARGADIAAASAHEHIFGYCIYNDLTARDLQFKEMQGPFGPAKGKDFDGSNVLGPVIVTQDEVGPQPSLSMRALVNDETWSEGNSGAMHWSFADIIEHVSRSETLHPGEILGSGTVGMGCGLELGRFLQHDDDVLLEIENIGSLRTRIHAPHVPQRHTL
ncbi:MAG TPA: fumarylacetoacetate hydrolase family protein [Steroidobacteraceae bacterium]|nr:fumarylacetoacetate hydrolase family protein [Steroidobacteraceae bacterium]